MPHPDDMPPSRIIVLALLLFPGSAVAHNTEGIAAALLAIIGWPMFVIVSAILARKGFRIFTGLVSALGFLAIISVANGIAEPLSEGSWAREYFLTGAITFAGCLLALLWIYFLARSKKPQ